MSPGRSHEYDAVLLPGGGLRENGDLPEWVRPRMDAALEKRSEKSFLITLSRGTPHKPPPLDATGRPLDEARVAAEYLLKHGAPARRILMETMSLDTIGNAFFARLLHTDPLGLRRLLVITSEFHMPRTRRIFESVYELDYEIGEEIPIPYRLDFHATPDTGLPEKTLRARLEKEKQSLLEFEQFMRGVEDMETLHERIHEKHGAYALNRKPAPILIDELAESY